ncbi:hypothetical protein HYALB_00012111 [Hymenoscyphus albidus]|uniref:Uncharacterized protein n=1 Tax=Hymenoscyphus albidus TaxID=595503 RepID=A0A9N9LJ18_9HELO|nr:hypothetical protein HYALB_00012111 [Hymenoscyphus albidus]
MPLPDPQSYTAGPSRTQDSAIKIGNRALFPQTELILTTVRSILIDTSGPIIPRPARKIPRHIVVLICMALMFLQRIVNIAVSLHVLNVTNGLSNN